MKTLNLTDLEKSDIKYKINNYPDGQSNITIESLSCSLHEGSAQIPLKDLYGGVEIKSRLNNFKDLELVICATKSLRGLGVREIHLYTPYFLGSRSDRKFEEGGNNYLKDVICPIINSLEFSSVTVLDSHSYVLEACLNNFRNENNSKLMNFAIDDLFKTNIDFNYDDLVLVAPDAGASHKILKSAESIGFKGDIITCSKERDENGKLTKCVVPEFNRDIKHVIIVDDLTDYGSTFVNIVKYLLEKEYNCNYYLVVSHSIQSEGLLNALKYFKNIYTTNSYKEHNIEQVKQLNIF